jgi:histidinol-phosphate aminotransferase
MTFKYQTHLDAVTRPALAAHNRAGWIGLDKNEPPFSLDPNLLPPLTADDLRTYPDPYPVYERLAQRLGVEVRNLLLCFGAEQALRHCFELVHAPGQPVVYPDPTFAMLDVFTRQFNLRPVTVSYSSQLTLDHSALLEAITSETRLVVVANPNNPTGTCMSLAELEQIAERTAECGVLFVIDEVYGMYARCSAKELLLRYPNVVIAQSFSKGWGLAGVRAGYLIGHPDTIMLLRKLKPIDELSAQAVAAAVCALEHPEVLERNCAQVWKWQEAFSVVRGSHIQYVPTHANFILLRTDPEARTALTQWCHEHRVLARVTMGAGVMQEYSRFAVGADKIMQQLLEYTVALG